MRWYNTVRTICYKAEGKDTKESMEKQAQRIINNNFGGGRINYVTDEEVSIILYTGQES